MSGQSSTSDPSEATASTWRRLYAVVLLELALTVALLYALARWAAS